MWTSAGKQQRHPQMRESPQGYLQSGRGDSRSNTATDHNYITREGEEL